MVRRFRTHLAPLWTAAFLATLAAQPADAHLSILRQGSEVGGAQEAGDQFGRAVAAGDINGDGFEDLIMGAPQEDIGSVANAGAIFVNRGSKYGVTHEGTTWYSAAHMTGTPSAGANLGWCLAVADLNRDGFDDVVVGAPFETIGSAANAGSIYIMRGSPSGLQPWLSLDQADFGANVETGDKFGFSIAIGNFNDDLYPDLVIGSPGEDNSVGAALYVLGTSVGPLGERGVLDLGDSGQVMQAGDQFGYSIAVGNLMAGPEDEIVCGAPFRSEPSGNVNCGAIMVTPGSPSGPKASSSRYYTAPGSAQRSANFGFSLAVGRLMQGPYAAVAVGEPLRDIHPVPDAGRVVVIPGGVSGLSTSSAVEVLESAAGGALGEDDAFGQAVAVGHFWDAADGWEDLAVGSPSEKFGTSASYGQVQILNGGPAGPIGIYGWFGFNQGTLNEPPEPSDALGWSLAFGSFDNTGFGNLAVGAIGENTAAGMVHVIAPWRQVYNLSCERSIVLDCNGDIYFSQKPFDRVLIASTTKIMTVLLACEESARGGPDLHDVYTVPGWVADQVPGSQVPLYEDETITLEDLMYTCLMRSGNDAAYAIADMVHGSTGPNESVVTFVNHMNAKAQLIGMTGTHFNNPAGLEVEPVGPDLGEHYSTPRDMAILSAYAMQNELFRQIAGTWEWPMVRHFVEFDIFWNVRNIFGSVLANNIEPLNGIKGGWTPAAQTTGCFSGESPLGDRTIAGSYTTPDGATMNYGPNAGALVQLGMAACGYYFALPTEWDFGYPFVADGIRSGADDRRGSSSAVPDAWEGDLEFSVFRTSWDTGEGSAMKMWLTHLLQLRGSASYELGAEGISGHGPIRITNVSGQPVTFLFEVPYEHELYNLGAGQTMVIPERDGSWSDFPVLLIRKGDGPLALDVEIPYIHEVTSQATPTTDPVHQTRLRRGDGVRHDAIEIRTFGLDAEPSSYVVLGHAPGEVAGAPEIEVEDVAVSGPVVRLRAPAPNPFRHSTQIGFDLLTEGVVGIDIYDVAGRRVRSFDAMPMPAGGWGVQWDGRTESGEATSPGVYFYKVTWNGEVAADGKLTRVQ